MSGGYRRPLILLPALAGLLAADTVDTGSPAVPFPGDHKRQKPRKARPPAPPRPEPVEHDCRQLRRRRERSG